MFRSKRHDIPSRLQDVRLLDILVAASAELSSMAAAIQKEFQEMEQLPGDMAEVGALFLKAALHCQVVAEHPSAIWLKARFANRHSAFECEHFHSPVLESPCWT
eukprot:s1318_g14.t1